MGQKQPTAQPGTGGAKEGTEHDRCLKTCMYTVVSDQMTLAIQDVA